MLFNWNAEIWHCDFKTFFDLIFFRFPAKFVAFWFTKFPNQVDFLIKKWLKNKIISHGLQNLKNDKTIWM